MIAAAVGVVVVGAVVAIVVERKTGSSDVALTAFFTTLAVGVVGVIVAGVRAGR